MLEFGMDIKGRKMEIVNVQNKSRCTQKRTTSLNLEEGIKKGERR